METIEEDNNNKKDVGKNEVNKNEDIFNMLISPVNRKTIFDNWSPKDVAIFECCMCNFGKKFAIFLSFV